MQNCLNWTETLSAPRPLPPIQLLSLDFNQSLSYIPSRLTSLFLSLWPSPFFFIIHFHTPNSPSFHTPFPCSFFSFPSPSSSSFSSHSLTPRNVLGHFHNGELLNSVYCMGHWTGACTAAWGGAVIWWYIVLNCCSCTAKLGRGFSICLFALPPLGTAGGAPCISLDTTSHVRCCFLFFFNLFFLLLHLQPLLLFSRPPLPSLSSFCSVYNLWQGKELPPCFPVFRVLVGIIVINFIFTLSFQLCIIGSLNVLQSLKTDKSVKHKSKKTIRNWLRET